MTLSDFRETFFDRYSAYPHETKQKAYLLFWGCCWAFIILLVFTICDLNWPIVKSPLKIIIACEGFFSILAFIGAICTWKRKYDNILKVITVGLLLMIFSQYFASLKWFTETGIFTHRESFYILLATVALFHSRRSLLLLAGAIICTTTFMLLIVGSNFSPQIIPYVKQAIINGTAVIILVTLLLYFSSLINERSIRTANIELEKNKELNRNLDQKVKDRTIELEDKNNMLLNIENNLKKYLPIQLVETITKGGQEEIESVSSHQRKKLTLFFSDIKDFTIITDNLEPEDMAAVLNEYLTEMNTIINTHKGTLAQVIGDGLYVIFGAPQSSSDKDNALRCVKMAIDMQRKMNKLNKRWFNKGIDEVLQIRCGINTGMATVGGYGSFERKEYTAMGMQTNIAARLEQSCTAGEILISHATWALVNDEIPCSEHGKVSVKGLNRPIRAYSIDGLSS